MKDRILALLGTGLQPSLVASAVGCSPAYITQLLEDQSFAFEAAALRVKDIEKIQERDTKWNDLEDLLLEKLQDLIPFMMRPREVIHALQIVNSAKRRSEDFKSTAPQQIITHNVVVLNLPTKTITQFELSKNNEITSIEGQSLTPLPTEVLMKELSQKAREIVFRNENERDHNYEHQNSDQEFYNSNSSGNRRKENRERIEKRTLSPESV